MLKDELERVTTRRRVVTTGAKLGYAVPLVAATYKLSARGALAACGGDTPYPFEINGELLCCGCCQQTGAGGGSLLGEAFAKCQEVLAANGIQCPLAGEAGSDIERVCIAPNVSP